jgi:hypothetical protein
MNDIFELSYLNEEIVYPIFDGFDEFCEDIELLNNIINPLEYLEEDVSNTSTNIIGKAGSILKNTKKTTTDVVKVYGNVTDSGGNILSSLWNMMMSAIRIITKITTFIVNKLALIPKAIAAVLKFIENIPTEIRNKIRGNIKIYITPDAIKLFYDKILPDLNKFYSIGDSLTKDDFWITFKKLLFDARSIRDVIHIKSDMKWLSEMNSIAKKLNGFNITLTTIEMQENDNAKIYFSNEETLNFKDYKGTIYNTSYFKALIDLVEELKKHDLLMKELNSTFSKKISVTEKNKEFLNLNKNQQNQIFNTVKNISIVIRIIGIFLSCVIKDMNTIKSNYNKILKSKSIKNTDIEAEKRKKRKYKK